MQRSQARGMSRIIDFYNGTLLHPRGVSIEAIWTWDNGQLEYEHSYIQWLFPLPESSMGCSR